MSVIDLTLAGTLGSALLPKRVDLVMYRGDSYEFVFNLVDESAVGIDFTGMTATCHFKTIVAGTEGASPTLTLTESTGVSLNDGAVDGKIKITLTAAQTEALAVALTPTYVQSMMWELQITSGSNIRTYLGGLITMHEDIVTNV